MNGPLRLHLLALFCLHSLWGCSEPADEAVHASPDQEWSDRQEVIHQLREVIRFEDEQERQRIEDLQALSLPIDPTPAAKPKVPTGNGQDQGDC